MQNIRNPKSASAVSAENKKPNILRRRAAFRPSSPIGEISGGRSLLTPESLKKTDPSRAESNIKTSKEHGHNVNNKETKTYARIRKPPQKIILDSYVCDKNRKSLEKPETNVVSSANRPVASVITNTSMPVQYDELLQDQFIVDGLTEDDQGKNGESSDLPTDGILQRGSEIVLSGELNREEVVAALESGGLGEKQLLVGEGSDQQYFWLCPIFDCNKLYSDRSALHVHILIHFDLSSFKCNVEGCSQEFISENQLNQHNLDTNHKEFIIPTEESFTQQEENSEGPRQLVDAALASVGITEDQIISVTIPESGRRWLCPYTGCELNFKTQYILKNHILMHYDLRPFKCSHEDCGWAFRSLYKLKNHTNVHGARSSGRHVCTFPGCHKTCSTKYNLSAHKRLHERSQDRRLACPAKDCTRVFQVRSQLEIHLTNDHVPQQAPHKCGSCSKRFWWSTGMAAHARAHANAPGEPVCSWPGCGRRFTQPCRLRYHIRSHTGDKPYRCTFPSCNWAFPSSGKLRRHARAHGGDVERRYVCETCGRAFLRSEHLREHLPRHLPHQNHQCDYPGCDQNFSNKSTVYAHKKRDHGIVSGQGNSNHNQEIQNNSQLENSSDFIQMQECEEEILSLRSARTHVPWGQETPHEPQTIQSLHEADILQHCNSCDEKQGNPLVCGGLGLEGEGPVEGAGLSLEGEGAGVSGLPELGSDLLGPSNDHINSLLLQEELPDGMLYATEEDTELHVLLLSE